MGTEPRVAGCCNAGLMAYSRLFQKKEIGSTRQAFCKNPQIGVKKMRAPTAIIFIEHTIKQLCQRLVEIGRFNLRYDVDRFGKRTLLFQ
ncbi:hypothetical protein ABFT80_27035 [Mesorhizobium sp. SB112]|uniref:hypothetical protein n=1 Tax=Mesorhizobium sp. SB112 TaxID=3151853 RepID=UPI00326456F0